jgi:hypothetical protein
VLLRGSSPFGLPQARVKHVPTQTAPLTVRPLPPAPPGFSGLVGDFTLTAQLGKTTVGVGESVPLTVEIVGTGSVDGFQLELPEIPDAQVYRDASTDQARLEQGRYLASKRFTNVLVPTRPGELRLPALEVVVFSPTAGEYVTLTTDPGVMQVSGQDVSVDMRTFGQAGASGDGPKPIELVEIYTWGPSVTPPLAPLAPLGLALVGLPGLLVLGLDGRDGLRRWWSGRRVRRVVAVRGRGRLRGLPPEPGARLAVLDLALREVLADRVKTTVAHLRRDEALAALEDEEAGPVRDAFAALDRARFAGGEVPDDAVDRVKAAFDALGAP